MNLRRSLVLVPTLLVLLTGISPNATARAPVVTAAGDIACGSSPPAPTPPTCPDGQHQATSDLVMGIDPDAVFVLGDAQYPNGEYQQFLANYDPTWGRFFRRTYPVPGNHDYEHGQNARGYFKYFGRRAHGPGGYYSFNLGKWHIIALNSNKGARPGRRQIQWLARNLRADRHRCELAFFHYPRWSSGAEDGNNPKMQRFWEPLVKNGVDVVLGAHDHNYERFAPMGVNGNLNRRKGATEFVVGTGGRNLNGFIPTPLPTSQVRIKSDFGLLKLRLALRGFSWQFIDIGSNVLDSGARRCHG